MLRLIRFGRRRRWCRYRCPAERRRQHDQRDREHETRGVAGDGAHVALRMTRRLCRQFDAAFTVEVVRRMKERPVVNVLLATIARDLDVRAEQLRMERALLKRVSVD